MRPNIVAPTANFAVGAHAADRCRRQPAAAAWTTAAARLRKAERVPVDRFRRRAACAPRRRWRPRTAGCSPRSRTRRAPTGAPAALTSCTARGEGQLERGLVVRVHGRVQVLVEHCQLRGGVVVDAELPLAENADYHSPSPACGCCAAGAPAADADSPPSPLASSCFGALLAISRFIASSSESTPLLAPSLSSSAWM